MTEVLLTGVSVAFLLTLVWFLAHMVVVVDGNSMLPAFSDGERLVVRRPVRAEFTVGDVVVIDARGLYATREIQGSCISVPLNGRLIKRVHIHPEGCQKCAPSGGGRRKCLFVLGDNLAESTDSRHFGVVDSDRVIAVLRGPHSQVRR